MDGMKVHRKEVCVDGMDWTDLAQDDVLTVWTGLIWLRMICVDGMD